MPTDKSTDLDSWQPGQQLVELTSQVPVQSGNVQSMLSTLMPGQQREQREKRQQLTGCVPFVYNFPGYKSEQFVLPGHQQHEPRGGDITSVEVTIKASIFKPALTGNQHRQQEQDQDKRRRIDHGPAQIESPEDVKPGLPVTILSLFGNGQPQPACSLVKSSSAAAALQPMSSALLSGQLQKRPRQFSDLPTEIQFMIFTEAICKPNIHFAKPLQSTTMDTWTFRFAALPKGQDRSGYRQLKELSAVNRVSNDAVRLATKKNSEVARLPFLFGPCRLPPRFDGTEDLVCIDFPKRTGSLAAPSEFMHEHNQLLTASLRLFLPHRVADLCEDVQKLAIKYSHNHHGSYSPKANFRCARDATNPHDPHWKHYGWRICPEELFAFVNCFPNLRELCIILEPSRSKCQRSRIEKYLKNYYTLPTSSPRRRSLAIYHATDHSYIELHRDLMRFPILDNPSLEQFDFGPIWLEHFEDINAMLDEMRKTYLLPDALPQAQWLDLPVFRMTLEQRKALVCKVLIPTNVVDPANMEEVKRGWEGPEREVVRKQFGA
ncbi:hypothetical protein VTI74DRAFT_4967 [Chaetomium olivicolor]